MRTLAALAAACLSAQTVRESGTVLRAGCEAGAQAVATLPANSPVRLRYALAEGGQPCYAVTVEAEGRTLHGYLPAGSLTGLERFEDARRRASSAIRPEVPRSQMNQVREAVQRSKYALASDVYRALDALEGGRPADAEAILAGSGAPPEHRETALVRAAALLELGQPERARGVLEAALRANPKDPQLLAMAGMAAYRLDDARSAVSYWKESLELQADARIQDLVRRAEREAEADRSSEKALGARFLLRYDGTVADPETARALVAALDQEYGRVSPQLGCRAEERIPVIVQSRESYRTATGAAEWNGGQFDGRIRIPMDRARRLDPATRQILAHEVAHACLATLGRWPVWLHEGVAQKMAGQQISPAQREALRERARSGKLPKLAALGQGWWEMSREEARVRYALALAAVELLAGSQGLLGVRNLLHNPERLPQVTDELDRELPGSLR